MVKSAPDISIEYQLWQKNWLTELSHKSLDLVSTIVDTVPENLYGKKMAEDELVIVMRNSDPKVESPFTIKDYTQAKHIVIKSITDSSGTAPLEAIAHAKGIAKGKTTA